jgi:hypothetical protein
MTTNPSAEPVASTYSLALGSAAQQAARAQQEVDFHETAVAEGRARLAEIEARLVDAQRRLEVALLVQHCVNRMVTDV